MAQDGRPTRVILVTGKGGAGKTTTAAATALVNAREGARTLLISADPAHSIGDVLDHPVPPARLWSDTVPLAVEAIRGTHDGRIHALALAPGASVDADWGVVHAYLADFLAGLGVDPLLADELTALPGTDDLTALFALARHVETGDWDLVVVDCAPTAETLRLLALPEVLTWHLERILGANRRLVTGLRSAANLAGWTAPPPEVMGAVATWSERVGRLRGTLTSPRSSVRIVLAPERVVIAEARRTLTALRLHGYAVDRIIVNRLLPTGSDPWLAAWNAAQRAGLEAIAESFRGIPTLTVPHAHGEPTGPTALLALADAMGRTTGEACPHDLDDVTVDGPSVAPDGLDFVLTIPAPLASRGEVHLGRRGDDLLVTVAGERRILALPSALRRCIVKNAAVGDGTIRVRFTRDERVWPRG